MSLRARLTLWVLTLFILLKVVITGVFWMYQRSTLMESFDRQLQSNAASFASDVGAKLPDLTHEELNRIANTGTRYMQFESFRVLVIGRDGSDWTKSGNVWPQSVFNAGKKAIETGQDQFVSIETDWFVNDYDTVRETRVVAMPIKGTKGNPYALVLATSTKYVHQQTDLIAKVMVATASVGVLATAISGWFIAGIAVSTIERIRKLAAELRPESLNQRIESLDTGYEVRQVLGTLNDARRRIRSAFETQERFLSNVSHEIKTPIATLLVEAQTIDKQGLSPQGQAFVKTAEEEMRRLGRLVESFLTLTRIRDGKGTPRVTRVLVNELILDSVIHCSPMAKQYAVRLDPHVLESDEHIDATIAGDADLLRTLVDNLIRNAIRFTPQDSVVTIIANILDEENLEILVQDEGPGLPEAMLSTAFDRFVQAPDEQRRGRGHGLGLSIAQAVAELHEGRIEASNRVPTGAQFRVILPLRHNATTTDGGSAHN